MSHSSHVGFGRPFTAISAGLSAELRRNLGLRRFMDAVGVPTSDPDAIAVMGGADVDRAEHSPSRMEPHLGQVAEYDSKPPRSEHWAVFHERVTGSNLEKDSSHLGPEPRAFTIDPGALASRANVLAREAAGNNIDAASPGFPIECAHIVPDGKRFEASVTLPGEEDAAGVGSNLNSASGAPSKEAPSQDASSCSCK